MVHICTMIAFKNHLEKGQAVEWRKIQFLFKKIGTTVVTYFYILQLGTDVFSEFKTKWT